MPTRRDFLQGTAVVAGTVVPMVHAAAGTDAGQNDPIGFARKLDAARIATGVTGASFAFWDSKTLHTAVSGMRNSVTADPVTLDTLMHVGSITKVMNATLMMQLVDE